MNKSKPQTINSWAIINRIFSSDRE